MALNNDARGADVRELAAETAGTLRAVLGEIEAGELDADVIQHAYLSGAVDALASVAHRPSSGGVSKPSL